MRPMIHTLMLLVLTVFWGLVRGDQTKPELDDLFNALQQSNDLVEMTELQNQIWFHWYELPEQSAKLQPIFDQGMQALHFGQPQVPARGCCWSWVQPRPWG